MAAADRPFQTREAIMAAFVGTGDEVLKMRVQLDIRDLLSRISVASSVGEVEVFDSVDDK